MKFKIKEINDIEGFRKALDRCDGVVNLITADGDLLNLKSKLSQLITINVILCGASQLSDIELFIEKESDAAILLHYIATRS